MKTPSLSKGLRFKLFSNGSNFVGVSENTLNGHNESQKEDLGLKEDALFQISKKLGLPKCAQELLEMVNMICPRLAIYQDVSKIYDQKFSHKWLKNMSHKSHKGTWSVG